MTTCTQTFHYGIQNFTENSKDKIEISDLFGLNVSCLSAAKTSNCISNLIHHKLSYQQVIFTSPVLSSALKQKTK